MPKTRNKDSSPRDKLLSVYQRLTLDGRKHFQTDLAQEENCSAQTIARVVSIIEAHLGKDAYIDSGLEGRRRYYQLRSKNRDKSLGFSFEELHYLTTCRDIAGQFLPESVVARIDRTLTDLALQLGERTAPKAHIGFRNKGFIDYAPHLPSIATLRQAIEKRQICTVVYRANGKSEPRSHRYAPGQLLSMNGTLYVQGYGLAEGSVLKERPTIFSVHRIAEVALTGEYFRFNAADADTHKFGLSWHEPKRVRIRFAPQAADYVRDRVWSDDQMIEELEDGGLVLEVTTTSEKELQSWVWSFRELAKVIDGLEAAAE
jgi:predicted DNA-binding transcriptional regulator YafY